MKKNISGISIYLMLAIPFQTFASTYYWVGGTGSYSDVAHWATTSGGSTFQSLPPTITDTVYFDANSFPSANDTVTFDLNFNESYDFIVNGVLNTPTFLDGPAALQVVCTGQHFQLDAGINWQSVCELQAGDIDPLLVQTNGVPVTNQVLLGADVSLVDDLTCYSLQLDIGVFRTNNHNIHCTHSWTCTGPTLYLGTSVITSDLIMDFLGSGTFYSDSSTLISPNFNVQTGIIGLHFGTVIAPYISAESSFFKVARTPNLMGLDNTIELLTSDTVGVSVGISSLGPNHISKVIALNVASFSANMVIDTLIFTGTGDELGLPDTVTLTGEIIMSNTADKPGMIAQALGDSCHLLKTTGTVCFDFVTMSNVHAIGGAQFFAGYNSIDNGGNSGFQFTGCTTAGGVWPGDANYDLTVNNMDILAIGLASGETGAARAGASYNWVEQPVANWAGTFDSGVNMKHADCDGNGTVDVNDTTAISVNYGFHHPAVRLIAPPDVPFTNALLSVDVTPDTVGPSSPVHVSIDLSIDSLYGIAFSIYYNPALIDASSLIPDFSNSWLGTPGVDMIGFAKADPAAGRIDFALTRTDHTDAVTGTGHLLSFDLLTASNIATASTLAMNADNINGLLLFQYYLAIPGNADSTFVDSTVSVLPVSNEFRGLTSSIRNGKLCLSFYSLTQGKANLVVSDLMGRIICQNELAIAAGANKDEIRIRELSQGIYVLSISGAGGKSSMKLVVE